MSKQSATEMLLLNTDIEAATGICGQDGKHGCSAYKNKDGNLSGGNGICY